MNIIAERPDGIRIVRVSTPAEAAPFRASFAGAYQDIFSEPPYNERFSPDEAEGVLTGFLQIPDNITLLALKGEERAHRFFESLARAATTPAVKRAAIEMAEEEREHVELVRAWMAKVPRPDDDWNDDPDPPRYTD